MLYTGNGGTQSITGLNFAPDWVWIRERNSANSSKLYDVIRGVHEVLESDNDGGEGTDTNGLTAFISDGFSVGSSISNNGSGDSYVAWNWEGGDSTVTNTSGSISSQVRASAVSGFSICTWTGNGSSGATIGHGLGVAPNFCFIKRRDTGGNNWIAASFDEESARELNTGNGFSTGDYDAFFPSQPSSTTVTLGTDSNNNTMWQNYVALRKQSRRRPQVTHLLNNL